jgi:hypothetical protein
MEQRLKVIVIGGGAAGFFGAITCAQLHPHCQVTIVEKSTKVLAKVKISGGGRCNVTHACFENRQLTKYYPRGEKELLHPLAQFSTQNTVRWFETRGVKLKTEADGRMFPVSDNSQTIVDCLIGEAKKAGVEVRLHTSVKAIKLLDDEKKLELHLQDEEKIICDRILIATGGHPNPTAYEWLSASGHAIESPVPSLFTFNTPASYVLDLAGVSVQEASVKIAGTKLQQTGPVLITHWGFSGPAVLRLSAWAARELHTLHYNFMLQINWVPQFNEETLRTALLAFKEENSKKTVSANTLFNLPLRLWKRLVAQAEISEEVRWADLPKKQMNKLIELLTRGSFQVAGKSTFKDEFVTCGGIQLTDINLQTMESKKCKGIFFAGEVLNIDGITGGFNFQNAWTTGYIAGKNIGVR